jgi:hypothetical protein
LGGQGKTPPCLAARRRLQIFWFDDAQSVSASAVDAFQLAGKYVARSADCGTAHDAAARDGTGTCADCTTDDRALRDRFTAGRKAKRRNCREKNWFESHDFFPLLVYDINNPTPRGVNRSERMDEKCAQTRRDEKSSAGAA